MRQKPTTAFESANEISCSGTRAREMEMGMAERERWGLRDMQAKREQNRALSQCPSFPLVGAPRVWGSMGSGFHGFGNVLGEPQRVSSGEE